MRIFTTLITFIALTTLLGCPDPSQSAGPADTCQSPGQQCRLGAGKLGVCMAGAGSELECVSQH